MENNDLEINSQILTVTQNKCSFKENDNQGSVKSFENSIHSEEEIENEEFVNINLENSQNIKEENLNEKDLADNLNELKINVSPEEEKCLEKENLKNDSNNENKYSDTDKKSNLFIPDDYIIMMRIGQGNFSEVFLVENIKTKYLFAMKQFSKRRVEQLRKQEDVLMEKHVMNKITPHKNLIGYGGSFRDTVKFKYYLNKKLFRMIYLYYMNILTEESYGKNQQYMD